ncbi:MAG: response regulator [Deltaproteobacteria bacterium]|nr:response regulator [Deltaproteobacteria bacterium]MBW2158646.1 response regulator [Deltaproteobacteria bacterium]MBW2585818.1 response regulator [Deltaproteobacteria bacterium]
MSALVLVADPDPFNLRLLHEACEAAGYDVVTAADGPEVLAMVARRPPDLLLLDAKMSEIDAFEILHILKADTSLVNIPVLLVTDEGDLEARRRGIELGAEDYLTRPYRVFEIQQRVRNVLRATRRDRLGIPESTPPADQRDPVTGAGTPSQLLISLDYEHTRAERYGHPLSCIVARLGNSADIAAASEDGTADRAMALIGSGLKRCIRAVDHLFRLRRDEFCILLPETDGQGAAYVLRRLDGQIESGELWGGDVTPTPAIQIALTSTPEASVKSGDDLLKQTRNSLTRKD